MRSPRSPQEKAAILSANFFKPCRHWVSYCIKHYKKPLGSCTLDLELNYARLEACRMTPGHIKNSFMFLSLSNRVLTCGQQSFELNHSKRHLRCCRTLYHTLLSPWGPAGRLKARQEVQPWGSISLLENCGKSPDLRQTEYSCRKSICHVTLKHLLALHHSWSKCAKGKMTKPPTKLAFLVHTDRYEMFTMHLCQ